MVNQGIQKCPITGKFTKLQIYPGQTQAKKGAVKHITLEQNEESKA